MASVEDKTFAEDRSSNGPAFSCKKLDFNIRVMVLALTVAGMVLIFTSTQDKTIPVTVPIPGFPAPRTILIDRAAKFNHSPALIYLAASLATTCFYSVVTLAASAIYMCRSTPSKKALFHLAVFDMLMAGVMASATGAGGAVAYIGLKGNSHVNWNKICNNYGSFCRHIGSSVAVSLGASIALVLLVLLSTYTLYRRSR